MKTFLACLVARLRCHRKPFCCYVAHAHRDVRIMSLLSPCLHPNSDLVRELVLALSRRLILIINSICVQQWCICQALLRKQCSGLGTRLYCYDHTPSTVSGPRSRLIVTLIIHRYLSPMKYNLIMCSHTHLGDLYQRIAKQEQKQMETEEVGIVGPRNYTNKTSRDNAQTRWHFYKRFQRNFVA